MAKPTAVAEVGGAKVLTLADATGTTPVANMPAAVEVSASGEATWPVGWMGMATHADGDNHNGAGGFTPTAAPLALAGGKSFEATPTVNALRADESGILLPAPVGYAHADLQMVTATATGVVITNSVTETALQTIDAARFAYLCSITGVCSVVGTNAAIATWTLKDGAAGTTLRVWDVGINSPVGSQLGSMLAGGDQLTSFTVPLKTNALNKQFTITASVATLGTWRFFVNGYLSTI